MFGSHGRALALLAAGFCGMACSSASDGGGAPADGGAATADGSTALEAGSDGAPDDGGGADGDGSGPAGDGAAGDAGSGGDAAGAADAGGDGASPGTACGLHSGTKFFYAMTAGKVIKVHLDGEIDEQVAAVERNGSNAATYPGGFVLGTTTLTFVGGYSVGGTPQPGWYSGTWPPAGGEGPSGILDGATLNGTGGANEGPLRGFGSSTSLGLAMGSGGVYKVDFDSNTSTVLTRPTLPDNYRVTEFLETGTDSFTVLASVAPATGTNNRAFTVAKTGATTWTTTEAVSMAIPADKPLVGVRQFEGHPLWFDEKGFWLDGTRVRDVRICFNGSVLAVGVSAVQQ